VTGCSTRNARSPGNREDDLPSLRRLSGSTIRSYLRAFAKASSAHKHPPDRLGFVVGAFVADRNGSPWNPILERREFGPEYKLDSESMSAGEPEAQELLEAESTGNWSEGTTVSLPSSSQGGRPKKVDIDKMHAYRDSIRDESNRRAVRYASCIREWTSHSTSQTAVHVLPPSRTPSEFHRSLMEKHIARHWLMSIPLRQGQGPERW
jgi:hypothetical protein